MDTKSVKQRLAEIIESHADEIISTGETIASHPELGFREFKTAEIVRAHFAKIGLPHKTGLGITGVRADLEGKASKCRVAYMAELDALVCPKHPRADPDTGAAHACGHNVQVAVMLGVAQAFVEAGIDDLDGGIAFLAVPAEELGQIEYRNALRAQGKLQFLTGKQELIAMGVLDDVDMAMMVHMQMPKVPGKLVTVGGTMNGAVAKYVNFTGVTAHAGSGPHLGVNALNAAILGLQAIHAQRETFKDEDCVRVHPIITNGGTLVNSVPDDVRLELFVRAKTVEALVDAAMKVDRAFEGGAHAIGARVSIENIPGYMPRIPHPPLDDVFSANANEVVDGCVGESPHINGSTDMGDVSLIMPAIHPWIHVVKGKMHGDDFEIADAYASYIQTAKMIAGTLVDLLANGAEKALSVKASSKPPMTKAQWLARWASLCGEKN